MGRSPCCDKNGLKKGPWTPEEDDKLIRYIQLHGPGNWRSLPKNAGLHRCGKSCRLRWTNYLRPDIKRGRFSFEEEDTIIHLHSVLGNKWSAIAARLPGRTDNEIKNYWNTHIRKKLLKMGIDPVTHSPRLNLQDYLSPSMGSSFISNNLNNLLGLQAILNPELYSLLGNLISAENQPNPETQLPNLIDQNQFQLPNSTLDHPFSASTQTQTQLVPNPTQYPNEQPGFDESWLNTNQSGFGFDCLGSTQLNPSCNTENYGMSLSYEVPDGCLDVNDFL